MPRTTADIKQSFDEILRDLDFHQSIISRTKGRLKKYPLRTFFYLATNVFLKVSTKLRHSPLIYAKTFWGDTMHVVFPMYRSIYNFGILDSWELIVQKVMVDSLKSGDVFVDVGANAGFYTLLGSALVGEQGQVHSFEPTPTTFALLKENAGKKSNVTLNPVALGSAPGRATLADYGLLENGLNSMHALDLQGLASKKIEVPVMTLDAYCAQKNITPTMIKMDVEGYELEVLRGAEHILGKKPALLVEVSSYEESAPLFSFLESHGYTGYYPHEKLELIPYQKHAHKRMNMLFV
jgi:FkbM family methyltransferase